MEKKKYRIEGNDIVIDVGKRTANEFIKIHNTPNRNQGGYDKTKPDDLRLCNVAKNKVIIDKLDEIFGYNKDVVKGKWDKFREYWEELGKPELECHFNLKAWAGNWTTCMQPSWYDFDLYRLKDDPNWEVRLAWVNSGKTLEIEFLSKYGLGWTPAVRPFDDNNYKFRIKPPKVVDKEQKSHQGECCEVFSGTLNFGSSPEQLLSSFNNNQQVLDNKLKALRYNKGKPQLSYLLDTPLANNELAKVFEEGAKKYERGNWKLGLENDKLMDSTLRHLQAYASGEEVDTETGCHHLAHVDWNVKVLLEQVLKGKESLNIKSDVLGGSVILNHVRRPINKPVQAEVKPIPITRKELAQELDKDMAYVEKMNDGQVVIINGTEFVVNGN